MLVIVKKKRIPDVCICTFEKKTHSTRSSWKMPKDNCHRRVDLTLVAHAFKFHRTQCPLLNFIGLNVLCLYVS